MKRVVVTCSRCAGEGKFKASGFTCNPCSGVGKVFAEAVVSPRNPEELVHTHPLFNF